MKILAIKVRSKGNIKGLKKMKNGEECQLILHGNMHDYLVYQTVQQS